MEKNIRNIRNEFKANGIFYTSSELAETLKRYVDFEPKTIYDPTCGQGNLLAVFDDDAEKYGQELFQDELDKASEQLKNFHGYCGDTLKDDGFPGKKFDLIIANPPFSIKWTPNEEDIRFKDAPCVPTGGKADYAFLLHILYHLNDKGKAVCLQFPGILYRGNREGKIRQWMVEQNFVERVVAVPQNQFVDTKIATVVLILNKSKDTTDIIFEELETGETKTVPFEEVKANGFNLSPSSYIIKETKKEQIDPAELEREVRQHFIEHIRRGLMMSKMIAKIDDSVPPFELLLDDIQRVIDEFRQNKT